MTERNDHTEAADQAERGADEMEQRSERLADDIEGTREDWERKQADESVPGAAGEPRAAPATRTAQRRPSPTRLRGAVRLEVQLRTESRRLGRGLASPSL